MLLTTACPVFAVVEFGSFTLFFLQLPARSPLHALFLACRRGPQRIETFLCDLVGSSCRRDTPHLNVECSITRKTTNAQNSKLPNAMSKLPKCSKPPNFQCLQMFETTKRSNLQATNLHILKTNEVYER